jgi:hypothetical protein
MLAYFGRPDWQDMSEYVITDATLLQLCELLSREPSLVGARSGPNGSPARGQSCLGGTSAGTRG